jgi:hypothetical protein
MIRRWSEALVHVDFANQDDADGFLAEIAVPSMMKTVHREGGRIYFRISFPRKVARKVRNRCQRLYGKQEE